VLFVRIVSEIVQETSVVLKKLDAFPPVFTDHGAAWAGGVGVVREVPVHRSTRQIPVLPEQAGKTDAVHMLLWQRW
jgi:hypothetical protein